MEELLSSEIYLKIILIVPKLPKRRRFHKRPLDIRPFVLGTPANQDVLSGFPDVFLTPKPNAHERPPFPAFFRRGRIACVAPVKGQISLPADSAYHHLADGWLDREPTSL